MSTYAFVHYYFNINFDKLKSFLANLLQLEEIIQNSIKKLYISKFL